MNVLSFGMGASKTSRDEAEKRAVQNLARYDWGFRERRHRYVVERQGKFDANGRK